MIISPLWSVESLGSGLRIKAYETKTWLLSEFQFSFFFYFACLIKIVSYGI